MGLIELECITHFKQEKMMVNSTIKQLRAGNNNCDVLQLFGKSRMRSTKITYRADRQASH